MFLTSMTSGLLGVLNVTIHGKRRDVGLGHEVALANRSGIQRTNGLGVIRKESLGTDEQSGWDTDCY